MWTPFIQYGFAGLSILLIAVVVWLISRILRLFEENVKLITANTAAMQSLTTHITAHDDRAQKMAEVLNVIHNKLQTRPCIARFEEGTFAR